MKQKREPVTHEEALSIFYGGVIELAHKPLPFRCKCDGTTYKVKDWDGEYLDTAVMSLPETFKHIRSYHKEFVIKKTKEEMEQVSI